MKTINLLTIIVLLVFSSCNKRGETIEKNTILSKYYSQIQDQYCYNYIDNDGYCREFYETLDKYNIGDNVFKYSNPHNNEIINPMGLSYIIDLPGEYTLMPHNPNRPDTMISWISNDTIFIRFKH